MGNGIRVRQARASDVRGIANLERTVYTPLGTLFFEERHVRSWLSVFPEGTLVAVDGADTVGFVAFQLVRYEGRPLSVFTDYRLITDHGLIRRSHEPGGESVYCVTVCSVSRGAGKLLALAMLDWARRHGKRHILGHSRVSGLDSYLAGLNDVGTCTIDEIVLWYVAETARMVGAAVSPLVGPINDAGLPAPAEPDEILRMHLRLPKATIMAVVPNAMPDPQSRGYSVLVVSDLT